MAWTREAARTRHRERYATDPVYREEHKARGRQWRQKNTAKSKRMLRASELKRLYGLTIDEYEQMVTDRKGLCDICGIKPEDSLCVDHNHITGEIRGLLCRSCNMALGKFGDSIKTLRNAIIYLSVNSQ